MPTYNNLFSPIKLGKTTLRNRIIMPAMGTLYADTDGSVNDRLISHYAERAKGGAGLIVVEVTSVDYPMGRIASRQLKLNTPSDIGRWMELSSAAHAHGAKIICQLHHSGATTTAAGQGGPQTVAPSEVKNRYGEMSRELTVDEIQALVQKFASSAVYAKMSGLDGIELHAGHTYLISQFLSPIYNKRTDQYGGSLENRARFLLEIIGAVRKRCGEDFLISVRYGALDLQQGGKTLEEGIEVAKLIDSAGIDLLNITVGVSGAFFDVVVDTQDKLEGSRVYMAEAIKKQIKTPVSAVGKLRTPKLMDELIASHSIDMVTVGRQFICDPMWPNKVQTGKEREVRKCLSCNEGCYGNVIGNLGTAECAINPYAGREWKFTEGDTERASKIKKVIVVGGGVAGMQAAVTAAKRGHDVTLLEKSASLGGQMHLATTPLHKGDLNSVVPWFTDEMSRQGVTVQLNCAASVDDLLTLKPDAVIVATGSVPFIPTIKGIEKATQSLSLLENKDKMPRGKRVVVIGGGTVGCETALLLASKGNEVAILEMLPSLAKGQEFTHNIVMMREFEKAEVRIDLQATVLELTDNAAVYTDKDGNRQEAPFDLAVVSVGQKSVGADMVSALRERGVDCFSAGDAQSVGNIRRATRSGFEAGYYI